ncbi:udp-glucose 4-epimerase [Holotrichia oblita]|nr:udp-glucose 4-epimerase [Holotrichia oblita]
MMKKILVTGGAGYIGSHTLIELHNAGFEAVIVDNLCNSSEIALKRVEEIIGKAPVFYKGDVRDSEFLNKIFTEHKIHSVIHFAGLKAVGESVQKPLMYYDNNLISTLVLLESMKKHGCFNLVFSSSATVYGDPEKLPLTEDCRTSTTNPYGATKLMIENILRDLYKSDNNWNIAILRYFNPIGAHKSGKIGEDPQGIPNNLVPYIAKVATGELKELNVFGNDYNTPDGTGKRDYIHVVDLAKGHIAALEKIDGMGLGVYNLGTGISYSVLEILHAYEKACGKKLPYKIVSRRSGDIAECYADPEYAFKELNWRAAENLESMCKDSYNWQSKNPKGYK